jgi:hypothetical protein
MEITQIDIAQGIGREVGQREVIMSLLRSIQIASSSSAHIPAVLEPTQLLQALQNTREALIGMVPSESPTEFQVATYESACLTVDEWMAKLQQHFDQLP